MKVEWGDGTSQIITNPEIAEWGLYFSSHEYAQYGTYNVKLTVDTSRGETKYSFHQETFEGPVVYPPVAMINCNVNHLLVFCGSFGSYDPQGGFLKYKFEYGNLYTDNNLTGNSSYSFSESGLYSVKLTVTNDAGQSTSAETFVQVVKPIPVNQLPIASFECRSDSPFTAICNDAGSVDLDGEVVIRKLTYDDGTFDFVTPGQNALHIFTSGGDHSFTYTVTDEDGGENTVTKIYNLKSNVAPVASFECSTPGPQKLSCYSTSTDPDVGDMPVKFTWVYDQGKIIEGLATTFDYTFAIHGEETIKLIVEDQYGLKSEVVKQFTTLENQAPTVNISCANTAGSSYQCDGTANDTDGGIVSYQWTIDGLSFSGNSVLYEFKNGGTYEVKLEVLDNLGKKSTTTTSIEINKPIISFDCQKIETLKMKCNLPQGFDLSNIVSVQYLIDEDLVFNTESIEHEFKTFGDHQIRMKIVRNDGEFSEVTKIINFPTQYLPPKADFNYSVDVGRRILLDAKKSLESDRKVQSYTWTFSDGTVETFTNSTTNTHTFQANTFYSISLKVIDLQGQSSLTTKNIFIFDPEVENPGELNDETELGIDIDQNLIRDDVQRWINFTSQDNLALKNILGKIAKNWQEQIINKK